MTDGTGLHVHDLSKRFGEVVALDGMSFGLERGGLVGFLGPNGSGKTTTMRTIMGLLRADGAGLGVDGRMPLLDQVTYFAELAGLSRNDARGSAQGWLEALDLGDRLFDDVGSLSHGNQQRVQLAVAL